MIWIKPETLKDCPKDQAFMFEYKNYVLFVNFDHDKNEWFQLCCTKAEPDNDSVPLDLSC